MSMKKAKMIGFLTSIWGISDWGYNSKQKSAKSSQSDQKQLLSLKYVMKNCMVCFTSVNCKKKVTSAKFFKFFTKKLPLSTG